MNKVWRSLLVVLVVAAVVMAAAGCRKAGPDDAETMALAKQFMQAVYVSHDAALAMTFVVPINSYGYVTMKELNDTVAAEVKNKCVTTPDSVQVGAPSGDVTIPEITATDTTKGITARTAWMVSSSFLCTGMGKSADQIAVVYLEKVNGKWGISKVTWQTGLGPQSPAG